MSDQGDRDHRSGSLSRFNQHDYTSQDRPQASKEIDVVAKLINEYEYASTMNDRERLEVLKKIENALKRNPQNCAKGPRFVSQLLADPNSAIRKSAFSCALCILSSPNNPRELILDSYRLALCSSNAQVSENALSVLPDFVNTCPEEASDLLKFGSIAHKRLPAPSTEIEHCISRALNLSAQ